MELKYFIKKQLINELNKTETKQNVEEKLRHIYDIINRSHISVFFRKNDDDWSMEYISENTRQMLGYSPEDFYRKEINYLDLIHPDDLPVVLNEVSRLKPEGMHIEYRMIVRSGETIWIEDRTWPVLDQNRKATHFQGVLIDITKRRQADEKLRTSEEFIRLVMDNLPIGIAVNSVDPTVTFNYMNNNFPKYYRTTKEKLTAPDTFWDAVYEDPEFREEIKKRVLDDCVSGAAERMYWEDVPITRKGDETTFITARNIPTPDKQLMISTVWDVTKRKKAEEKLQESETRYREVVEGTSDLITVTDSNGRFLFVNHMAENIFGIDADKCIGMSAFRFIHSDDREETEKWFSECIRKQVSQASIENRQINQQTGNVHNMFWVCHISYDEEGQVQVVNGIARDITERKKLEEELQKSHKIKSVGILAGGIAHDFNNLLSAILNNIHISKMHANSESNVYKNLESAEKAIYKATNLTLQLLTFARGGTPVKKTASIAELITDSAEFTLKGSNVKCEYIVADDLLAVEVDGGQMNQVIQNLILNADQAMPEGGAIRINIENSILGSDTGLPLPEGKHVKIVLQDQGTGISEEHLQKIFDPYFTLKGMGRGLGLSIVYSIIKQHKGYISTESEVGVGTTFTIYLPASEKFIEEKVTKEEMFVAGEGKILVMDDEEVIRSSVGEILKIAGYEVELAEDGNKAIELYKKAMESSKPFDVVILDLTIRGGMGGKETIKKLLELDPDVKAIVTSGYSNDPVMANFREYGFSDVYCKASSTPDRLCNMLHKLTLLS